ncbi:MAG: ABC transporter permease [Chloroflexota bacterium]|jgi:putative ABC transport system permease protein
MRLLRDLGRRRLRTTLTILGITIGIWALVVFGSMANKINAIVDGGSTFYADKVTVAARGSGMGFGQPMDIGTAAVVESIDGVAVAMPSVGMPMDGEMSGGGMGMEYISGQVAGADQGLESYVLSIANGRELTPQDEGAYVTVLGSDLARQFDVSVGDSVEIRGRAFEVVGVLEPTLTMPDSSAMMPLAASQELYVEMIPTMFADELDPSQVVTGLTVYPEPGVDPEALAEVIRAADPTLEVMSGSDFDEAIGSTTAIFNAILVGIALISLAVGGLSVINTMAMSVAERTREIGIKRAIGGSRIRIVSELVAESALIGFLGGITGLALGAAVAILGNELGRESGFLLFLLTPWTAITAVAFSTLLGAVAGFIPALHAARLDPVAALRYE